MTSEQVETAAALLGERCRRHVAIGPFTTYHLGGEAALLLEAQSEDDLQLAKKAVAESGIDVVVIGKGSNMLVADAGFDGLVIVTGGSLGGIEINGTTVRAGSATPLPVLARKTAAAGLHGLEWAVGVPGTVGGALRMNAGGHGSQTVETLRRYCFVDLHGASDGIRRPDALDLSYRHSNLLGHQVIVWAEHELTTGDKDEAEAKISEIVKWRREHQPGGRNAGSVFTNPAGDSSGRLIDEAGLRGFRIGSAAVSDKHANFIQADDGAKASDVVAVMREVRRRVFETSAIELVHEIRLVGFHDDEIAGL